MHRDIVFATNNAHKLSEIRRIIGERFRVLSLSDIGCHEDIPETGMTLEENALMKARYVREHYGYDCFADDTGLLVDALGGAPGVYSARYAGGDGHDSEANMRLLLRNMDDKDNRSSRFRTVIALIEGDVEHLFKGECEGLITREREGTDGFGYDPVFLPTGYNLTFAQMSPDEKNAISHRGRAVSKLISYLID